MYADKKKVITTIVVCAGVAVAVMVIPERIQKKKRLNNQHFIQQHITPHCAQSIPLLGDKYFRVEPLPTFLPEPMWTGTCSSTFFCRFWKWKETQSVSEAPTASDLKRQDYHAQLHLKIFWA